MSSARPIVTGPAKISFEHDERYILVDAGSFTLRPSLTCIVLRDQATIYCSHHHSSLGLRPAERGLALRVSRGWTCRTLHLDGGTLTYGHKYCLRKQPGRRTLSNVVTARSRFYRTPLSDTQAAKLLRVNRCQARDLGGHRQGRRARKAQLEHGVPSYANRAEL